MGRLFPFWFKQEDIPELIRLGTDRALLLAGDEIGEAEMWAPMHGWRALVQMFAAEAIRPPAEVLAWSLQSGSVLINEGLSDALVTFGAPVIEPLEEFLNEPGHGNTGYISAGDIVSRVGEANPEYCGQLVEVISSALEKHFERNNEDVNGFWISPLLDPLTPKNWRLNERANWPGRKGANVRRKRNHGRGIGRRNRRQESNPGVDPKNFIKLSYSSYSKRRNIYSWKTPGARHPKEEEQTSVG